MGSSTTLRHLLKCLCHNTNWKYAVLWKLRKMELTWEDVYFDKEGSDEFFCGRTGISSFGSEIDIRSGYPMKCPIEMALMSLSVHSYLLGEGIVGQVASERKHHWSYADAVGSKLQFPEEWSQQLVAGVKTILLVPVIPLGVVQLGSLNMILDDLNEVIRISNYFGTIQSTSGTSISLSSRMEQPDCYTQLITSSADIPLAVDVFGQILNQLTCPYTDENNWPSTCKDLLANQIEEPLEQDPSVLSDIGDMSTFYCLEDRQSVFPSINQKLISGHRSIRDLYVEDLEHRDDDKGYRKEFDEDTNFITDHAYLSFPSKSELHEALGPSLMGHEDCMWDAFVSKADEWSKPPAYCQISLPEVHSPAFDDVDVWCTSERTDLLDVVIEELLHTPDDNESKYVRSCSNSPSKCSDSCLTQCRTEDDALDLGELVSCKAEDDAFDLGESVRHSGKRVMLPIVNAGFTSALARTSDKSVASVPVPEKQRIASEQIKKETKSTKINKKRNNTADDRRPKPRDRQLIQDRIKELRGLIPDGSKCSIDALLDRTIKHMLFLQSVPTQTEKLSHPEQAKVKGEYWGSHGYDTCQDGASWAYELSHQSEECPLIVENLDLPGQILVEMRCKDYGLFLDIAQVIRRLKLIILRGSLEIKSDNPRATFIVEAPRGFHRMDILWPLVELLQRNNIPMTKLL